MHDAVCIHQGDRFVARLKVDKAIIVEGGGARCKDHLDRIGIGARCHIERGFFKRYARRENARRYLDVGFVEISFQIKDELVTRMSRKVRTDLGLDVRHDGGVHLDIAVVEGSDACDCTPGATHFDVTAVKDDVAFEGIIVDQFAHGRFNVGLRINGQLAACPIGDSVNGKIHSVHNYQTKVAVNDDPAQSQVVLYNVPGRLTYLAPFGTPCKNIGVFGAVFVIYIISVLGKITISYRLRLVYGDRTDSHHIVGGIVRRIGRRGGNGYLAGCNGIDQSVLINCCNTLVACRPNQEPRIVEKCVRRRHERG